MSTVSKNAINSFSAVWILTCNRLECTTAKGTKCRLSPRPHAAATLEYSCNQHFPSLTEQTVQSRNTLCFGTVSSREQNRLTPTCGVDLKACLAASQEQYVVLAMDVPRSSEERLGDVVQ
eukprot:5570563-Pleurochrysis_carterae.AAC.1